jgi:endonuclease YncB( thermonuclease family)
MKKLCNIKFSAVALLLLIILGCQYRSQDDLSKVVGVKDGDTIEILNNDNTTQVVRLLDIDCPERGNLSEKWPSNTVLICVSEKRLRWFRRERTAGAGLCR